MVRLSAQNYNTLPKELRDKAKNRILAYASRSKIALAKYKNDRHLVGFVWKKLDKEEQEALKEIYKSGGVSVNETTSGITLEYDETPTESIKGVAKVVHIAESADKTVSNVVSTVGNSVIKTGRTIGAVGSASGSTVRWLYNRSLTSKVIMACVSTCLYVQFMERYKGGSVPEFIRNMMVDSITVGGYTVGATTAIVCIEAVLDQMYKFSSVWKKRIDEQLLSERLEKEIAERKADHEKYLKETRDAKDEQQRRERIYEDKIRDLERDKMTMYVKLDSSRQQLNTMLFEGVKRERQAQAQAEVKLTESRQTETDTAPPATAKPAPKAEPKPSVPLSHAYDKHIADMKLALGLEYNAKSKLNNF